MPVVHAVVVAYNRRKLLHDALTAISEQSLVPDVVHVIDNASTDGTAEMVREQFPDARLHQLSSNTGGAGGFAVGLAHALADAAEWVWLMDDDTVPTPDALQHLVAAQQDCPGRRPALVASRVVWTDGEDHPMNTPRRRPGAGATELAQAEIIGCLPIRSASFVSVLVDAGVVAEVGLPVAEFFIWNDDFEFTTRLLREHRGLYCAASVVEHRTKVFGSTSIDPGERFYYEVRNKVWTFLRSEGLTVPEKALYGGSTLRRWGRTFAASGDRQTLRAGLRRGLVDGLRRGPRDSVEVLADSGVTIPRPSAAAGSQ